MTPAPVLLIRAMRPDDWPALRAIYAEGVATRDATFEQQAPDWGTWDGAHLPVCRVVAKHAGLTAGWAALSPYSKRAVYAGVAEVSVYVAEQSRGRGVGIALMQALIAESDAAGIWTLQAGIFPENQASLRLHERAGFRVVGRRERIGYMDGRRRDVVLMERRSAVAG